MRYLKYIESSCPWIWYNMCITSNFPVFFLHNAVNVCLDQFSLEILAFNYFQFAWSSPAYCRVSKSHKSVLLLFWKCNSHLFASKTSSSTKETSNKAKKERERIKSNLNIILDHIDLATFLLQKRELASLKQIFNYDHQIIAKNYFWSNYAIRITK